MTGLTSTAIAVVRKAYGPDADAVLNLRAAHKTVRRYKGQYVVNEVPVDSAELNRLADELQARQAAKARRTKQKTAGLGNPSSGEGAGTTDRPDGPGSALATNSNAAPDGCVDVIDVPPGTTPQTEALQPASVTPAHDAGELGAGTIPAGEVAGNAGGIHDAGLKTRRQEVARVAPPAVLCKCGNPNRASHGRCWVMRGMSGPTLKRADRGLTCAGCGGPRSRSALGMLCRKCVLAKNRKTSGQAARIMALECEVDALKSAVERMRVQMAMEGGR